MPENTSNRRSNTDEVLAGDPRLQQIKQKYVRLRIERMIASSKGNQVRTVELRAQMDALRVEETKIKTSLVGPRPRVERLNISLSPNALDTIDNLKFALQFTRNVTSTSALIEAALLNLEEYAGGNAQLLLDTVEKHVGAGNTRRRATSK